MKTLLTGARVWRADHTFSENCPVLLEDGAILGVGESALREEADTVRDLGGAYLLPGLVDVHTHGRAGYDFNDATKEQMCLMRVDYARCGVTSVMATLASDTREGWERAIENVKDSGYIGLHLEGRYLNPSKRGAHAAHLLTSPDPDELGSLLAGVDLPVHVSFAAELDPDGSFLSRILSLGATAGLAHTAATAEEARRALARGLTSFTHLFNAMPPLHHREGGPVSVALSEGGYAELIADGVHVCPDMVKLAYKNLGADRTVLITDSMAGTGCPDGEYRIAGLPVTVKNGRALTSEGAIAGSTLDLFDGMKNLMHFAGATLGDAVACATLNPARMVGIDLTVGSIDEGKRADLLIVDGELRLLEVIMDGQTLEKGENL